MHGTVHYKACQTRSLNLRTLKFRQHGHKTHSLIPTDRRALPLSGWDDISPIFIPVCLCYSPNYFPTAVLPCLTKPASQNKIFLKGIVQRILRGVVTRLIPSLQVNWRLAYFKETPSQEEHRTIFSGLKINEMALSDQCDFPAFSHLRKTYWKFINSGI